MCSAKVTAVAVIAKTTAPFLVAARYLSSFVVGDSEVVHSHHERSSELSYGEIQLLCVTLAAMLRSLKNWFQFLSAVIEVGVICS